MLKKKNRIDKNVIDIKNVDKEDKRENNDMEILSICF